MDIAAWLGVVLHSRRASCYCGSMPMLHCPFMEAYPVLLVIVLSIDTVCT